MSRHVYEAQCKKCGITLRKEFWGEDKILCRHCATYHHLLEMPSDVRDIVIDETRKPVGLF